LETNGATKYTILNNFKTAVEDGQLVINDVRILKEMRSFTYSDANDLGRTRQGLFTNHGARLLDQRLELILVHRAG
jgi:hypothetical protein